MAECIEREAAIAEVEEWYEMYPDSDAAREALSLAKRAIRKLPAADVRPVVKAHWIKCNRGAGYKCSVCKARSSYADVLHGNHKFCYKCGAMMEKS